MQIKKDINLIPKNILKKRKTREQTGLMFLIVVFAIILFLTFLLFSYNQNLQMQRRIIKLERDIEAFPDIYAYEETHTYYSELLEYINDVIVEIDKDDYDILNMLKTIELRIPSSITLASISVSGNKVTMSGQAENDTAIADFIYGIKRLGLFEDIFVPSLNEAGGSRTQKAFNIGMTIVKEGENE